jgi:hypothetical protein
MTWFWQLPDLLMRVLHAALLLYADQENQPGLSDAA